MQRRTDRGKCKDCGAEYLFLDRIWRFMPNDRVKRYEEFLNRYRDLRRHDGWGSDDGKYYRQLPQVTRDDRHYGIWRIREKNFRRLLGLVGSEPQKILDLGAGNGWLSNQFAKRGHLVAALDLSDDDHDGLGACKYYQSQFECYQAEFECAPFCDLQFDLAIFNASLHYSSCLGTTLRATKRLVKLGGMVVVVDSPYYNDASSGQALAFEQRSRLGLDGDLGINGFLTVETLTSAARESGMQIEVWYADLEWHKRLRRKWVQSRLGREPAHFPIILLKH